MHWWKSLTAVCSKPCTSHPGLIGDLRVANSPSLLPVPPPVPKGTLPLALFPWEKMAREGGLEVVVPNSALWKWIWLFLRMRRWRFLLKEAPYRCFNKVKILLGWWQTCFPQVKNDGKDLRILNWKILCDTKQRRTSFATTVDTEPLEAKPKLQIKMNKTCYEQSWKVPGTRSHWEFSAKVQIYSKNAFENIDLYLWKSPIKQKRFHKEKCNQKYIYIFYS